MLGYVTKRHNDDDGDDDDATKCNAKRNENGDGCRTTDAISLGCAAPKRRRRLVVELSMTKRAKQRDRARERVAERTKAARDAQRGRQTERESKIERNRNSALWHTVAESLQ